MVERVNVSKLVHGLLETKRGLYIAPERKTLASGKTSYVYFNIGDEVISHPYLKDMVVNALVQTYRQVPIQIRANVDRLVGVPEGANMLASSFGDRVRIGQLRIRETKTEHGDQCSIEGSFDPNMKVAIIEDVIGTGGSTNTRANLPLLMAKLIPTAVIALIDRQYGGVQKFRNLGYAVQAFATTTEIAEVLINENLVSDQQIRLLQEELGELKTT